MTVQDTRPSETRVVELRPWGGGYNGFRIHFVKQPLGNALVTPALVRAPGSARSPLPFLLPRMRGWRARGACHGFRRGGPGITGRPRARGLTHPCADASAPS